MPTAGEPNVAIGRPQGHAHAHLLARNLANVAGECDFVAHDTQREGSPAAMSADLTVINSSELGPVKDVTEAGGMAVLSDEAIPASAVQNLEMNPASPDVESDIEARALTRSSLDMPRSSGESSRSIEEDDSGQERETSREPAARRHALELCRSPARAPSSPGGIKDNARFSPDPREASLPPSTASTPERSQQLSLQSDDTSLVGLASLRIGDEPFPDAKSLGRSTLLSSVTVRMGGALGIDFGEAMVDGATVALSVDDDDHDGLPDEASLKTLSDFDRPEESHGADHARPTGIPPSGSASPVITRQVPPLLCATVADRCRVPFRGNSCLYPGSTFRGTQTSGRSSYDVEARIVEVDLPGSSVSGYLSISHLTDSHPTLTTFFTGQIVGSKHGFLTCSGGDGPPVEEEYGRATEQDDMRHWSRFEHFRKVRNELRRPSLTLRDTVPGMERDRTFLFMRWKERFLVPDHKVKDISGASFAGFYYLQLDMEPSDSASATKTITNVVPMNSTSTAERRRPSATARPSIGGGRRSSHSTATTNVMPVSPGLGATRRASSNASCAMAVPRSPGKRAYSAERLESPLPPRNAPIITGYYFHHQNSEPFQELNLRHIPQRGRGSVEMR